MFDVGFWELVLCLVVALVVLGPERMPVAVRQVARWFNAARATLNAIKTEFEHELELDKLKAELQQQVTINPEPPVPVPPPQTAEAVSATPPSQPDSIAAAIAELKAGGCQGGGGQGSEATPSGQKPQP